jgi:hypothetical protein
VSPDDVITVAFDERIADTIAAVRQCPSPVPRSCHVGNNGAYNWGWLALAGNSRVLLYDHTTYGADRICLPWAVLDDDGRAAAVYDVDGREIVDLGGSHAGTVAAASPARYRSILNYGVPATHGQLPLATHHFLVNSRLAAHFNGSVATFDAREALRAISVVESIVVHALRDGCLSLLFDRWVERRRSRVVFTKVAATGVDGERVSMSDAQGGVLFAGSAAELLEGMRASLEEVDAHIAEGRPLGPVSYPWLSLPFAYLLTACVDHLRAGGADVAYHAGGLTSPYYMGAQDFISALERLADWLGAAGFLPRPFRFVLIPIGGCQLFSGDDQGREALGRLVACWRDALDSLADRTTVTSLLTHRAHAYGPELAWANGLLDEGLLRRLTAEVRIFNSLQANRLPICYDAEARNGAFNKYGAGPDSLLEMQAVFPEDLSELTWLEAEWLCQVVATRVADEAEPV